MSKKVLESIKKDLDLLDKTLCVPAAEAEYVPAIADAFKIIDRMKKSLEEPQKKRDDAILLKWKEYEK